MRQTRYEANESSRLILDMNGIRLHSEIRLCNRNSLFSIVFLKESVVTELMLAPAPCLQEHLGTAF